MHQFLGKLSLYDIIVMVIPGGTILSFFLDYYGVDLLFNGSYDISSLAVWGGGRCILYNRNGSPCDSKEILANNP